MKLTPLQPQDLPILQKWLGNKLLLSLLEIEPLCTDRPFYLFAARTDDGGLVGWGSIYNLDVWNKKAEIGMVLPQGKGLGLPFLARLLSIAFDEVRLNRIAAKVRASNTRVIKALEGPVAKRFGFVREGVERQGYFRNGITDDLYVFGLTKEVWVAHGRSGVGFVSR